MNDQNLNIRASGKLLKLLKEKAKRTGVDKSKLVRIAIEVVTDDQVMQYLLDRVDPEQELKVE